MGKTPWSAPMGLDDERFDSFMLLAICCMDTFVSFPTVRFKVMYRSRD